MNAFLPAAALGSLSYQKPIEQVGAEADAFPPDEEQREVVREDERQHREDEQVHVREEAGEPRVVRHVRPSRRGG